MIPNPGSKEAVEIGCTCPIADNNGGQGFFFGDPEPMFWNSSDCPLHGEGKSDEDSSAISEVV